LTLITVPEQIDAAPPRRAVSIGTLARPRVEGPFLVLAGEKLTVKGVTYGTFAEDPHGDRFPARETVRADFAALRAAGANTVRTYTPPPDWLLEEARSAGLRVLVGIYWEGRNCDYDDPRLLEEASRTVREAVRRCRRFPDALLGYAIGNEVPSLTVRLHGRRIVEDFLHHLYDVAKFEDPEGLVTYANFPPTEFLELSFLDFHTLNVYLLERRTLSSYLDRMLIQSQGKPLVLGEVGDDTLRKGVEAQAALLDWTIPLVLDKGLAGLFVFAWTDEWVVGRHRVDDWHFGLVDAQRRPKPALDVVRRRFTEHPLARRAVWPRISVVVCNYNGAETLEETLSSLVRLDYPDFEVIYVDDGSTDESLAIARRFERDVRIIAQENQGLSVARNVGISAATGEIVAYIDSDAFADRDWLRHLVLTLDSGDYVAVGGPNLTPESDGRLAKFIAVCPGNPTYVLKDNVEADHIAGVNMAFRRSALLQIGGFDPVHRKAGDDVDVCWRIEDAGMRIAFAPAAIVWHHRRPSIKRYLLQQYGYGEAENQLEVKHPERFNLGGYIRWRGRVYVAFRRSTSFFKPFIYHGHLGTGMFQTLYQKDPNGLMLGPGMVQWYLVAVGLIALFPISLWLLAAGAAMLTASLGVALLAGFTTEVPMQHGRRDQLRKVWTVTLLHFLHPLVRWWGRAMHRRNQPAVAPGHARAQRRALRPLVGEWLRELWHLGPYPKERRHFWGLPGHQREAFLLELQTELKARGESARMGHSWDNWDLAVDGDALVNGRIHTAPEHYDQALCVALMMSTTTVVRGIVYLLAALALWATLLGAAYAVLWIAPAAVFAVVIDRKAEVRRQTWQAVEAAAIARGMLVIPRRGKELTASGPSTRTPLAQPSVLQMPRFLANVVRATRKGLRRAQRSTRAAATSTPASVPSKPPPSAL
jgi:glycosyltransferase involved in cell wall biosynthesis